VGPSSRSPKPCSGCRLAISFWSKASRPPAIPKLEVYRASVAKSLLHPADPHIVAIATDTALVTSLPRFDIGDVAGIAAFIAACRLPAPAAWN
jgi:Molybdopterin-guanine dinucleotide biosynthesis protein